MESAPPEEEGRSDLPSELGDRHSAP